MLPVVWLPSAEEDLELTITYIAELNPAAARKLKTRLEDSLLPLSEHPYPLALLKQEDKPSESRRYHLSVFVAAFVANLSLRVKHLSNSGCTIN